MFVVLLLILLLQRLFELVISERNRRWTLANGGVESGQGHYPLILGLHALFYVSLILERLYWSKGWDTGWPLWVGILLLAQILRAWCVATLGRFWNTRIIVIPGTARIVRGPYRFVRHPNYWIVVVEIAVIPVLCGAYATAIMFTVVNAIVLGIRIRVEDRALSRVG